MVMRAAHIDSAHQHIMGVEVKSYRVPGASSLVLMPPARVGGDWCTESLSGVAEGAVWVR